MAVVGRSGPVLLVDILSPTLAICVAVLALLLPVLVAAWWAWRSQGSVVRRVGRGAVCLVAVVVCQATALTAVFLHVNGTYGFFTSWDDALGEAPAAPTHDLIDITDSKIHKIPVSPGNPHPDGLMAGIRVRGTDPSRSHLPVWLPPQYFEKSQARTRFPVLFWIGGLNDTAGHANVSVPLTGPALSLIRGFRLNPFAIVFLPGQIRAGADTECTDVAGIDHRSWLTETVVPSIEKHYRVGRSPNSRFMAGWSTGGYCAANLTTRDDSLFRAGFGLAPYFHPTYSEPILSRVSAATIADNSPIRRVKEGRVPHRSRFLSVMSRTDRSSWGNAADPPISQGQVLADGQDFYNRARVMPQFSFILLDSGGHHPGTYTPYLSQCLRWLGQYGL